MSKQLQFSLLQPVLRVYGVPVKTSEGSDSQVGTARLRLGFAHSCPHLAGYADS